MDVFLYACRTADKRPLAIGGFCVPGRLRAVLAAYTAWEKLVFGDYKDPFVIDMRLSRLIREYSPPDVLLVGASIRLDNCAEPGGGILGIPGKPDCSADGTVQSLWDGMYSLAFPGAVGFAAQTDLSNMQKLEQTLRQNPTMLEAHKVRALVEKCTDTYLLVCDGSGGVRGCVMAQKGEKRVSHWL